MFSGSKYPKCIRFNFENRSTVRRLPLPRGGDVRADKRATVWPHNRKPWFRLGPKYRRNYLAEPSWDASICCRLAALHGTQRAARTGRGRSAKLQYTDDIAWSRSPFEELSVAAGCERFTRVLRRPRRCCEVNGATLSCLCRRVLADIGYSTLKIVSFVVCNIGLHSWIKTSHEYRTRIMSVLPSAPPIRPIALSDSPPLMSSWW